MASFFDCIYCAAGMQKCNSLVITQRGIFLHDSFEPIVFDTICVNEDTNEKYQVSVEIKQKKLRTIKLFSATPIPAFCMTDLFLRVEQLLMIFDGRFYAISSIRFFGNPKLVEDYRLYAKEWKKRKLVCYSSLRIDCDFSFGLQEFPSKINSQLFKKWEKLCDELDIVHKNILYNISSLPIPVDIKCASVITSLEPLSKIVRLYNSKLVIKKKGKTPSLGEYIDFIISNFGTDIFKTEYDSNKNEFLSILVKTRHRIMHVKRKQTKNKFLSGPESLLFLIKFSLLYRVIILSLLGFDYCEYKDKLLNTMGYLNSWQNVLNGLLRKLEDNKLRKTINQAT